MIIYIVQPGDSIESISETYGIPAERLIQENGLETIEHLVVGQSLVILYPEKTYTVKSGDTLADIAQSQDITLIQLLRNNPFLSDREFIYPGETLIISYKENKLGHIATNGYTYPFIDRDILRKTLPFLTYLTIFNYRATADGDLTDINDTDVIGLAKAYGVAPIMLISTLSTAGTGSIDIAYSILNNPDVQDRLINNILTTIKAKGYYGLNINLEYINPANQALVENYIAKVTTRLNEEGYPVVLTLTPTTFAEESNITYEDINYTILGKAANSILLLSYEWGFSYGPPASVTSISTVRKLLDYAVTQVSPEKILFGIPIIGYDWKLPYVSGISRANSLSTNAAIQLACEMGATIQYNEAALASFYTYVMRDPEGPSNHIVWYKDTRRMDVLAKLVPEYKFQGIAIWNIMQYYAQLWLLINSQFEIITVLNT